MDGFNVGYGGELTWYFDVLSATVGGRWNICVSEAATSQISATPSMIRWTGGGVVYKPHVLGFNGTLEIYGDTEKGTTRTQDTTFVAGNTYKYVYIAPSDSATADGSAYLYECPTELVGTDDETWTAIMYVNNIPLTYSPISSVKIGLWTNATMELVVDNYFIKIGDDVATSTAIAGGASMVDYVA